VTLDLKASRVIVISNWTAWMDGVFRGQIPDAKECVMNSEDTPMPSDTQARMENARQAMSEVILRKREDQKKHVREPRTLHELQPNRLFQADTPSVRSSGKSGGRCDDSSAR
jgi:hypothetical protein